MTSLPPYTFMFAHPPQVYIFIPNPSREIIALLKTLWYICGYSSRYMYMYTEVIVAHKLWIATQPPYIILAWSENWYCTAARNTNNKAPYLWRLSACSSFYTRLVLISTGTGFALDVFNHRSLFIITEALYLVYAYFKTVCEGWGWDCKGVNQRGHESCLRCPCIGGLRRQNYHHYPSERPNCNSLDGTLTQYPSGEHNRRKGTCEARKTSGKLPKVPNPSKWQLCPIDSVPDRTRYIRIDS